MFVSTIAFNQVVDSEIFLTMVGPVHLRDGVGDSCCFFPVCEKHNVKTFFDMVKNLWENAVIKCPVENN